MKKSFKILALLVLLNIFILFFGLIGGAELKVMQLMKINIPIVIVVSVAAAIDSLRKSYSR